MTENKIKRIKRPKASSEEERRERILEYKVRYRKLNKAKLSNRAKELYRENKDKRRASHKKWVAKAYAKNPNIWKEYNKRNRPKTPEKKRQRQDVKNAYFRMRIKTDPVFRIKRNLRNALNLSIRRYGDGKKSHLSDLVGCSFSELKAHLESQFNDLMNWKNYGKYWHIDHRKPCAWFDLESIEQQKLCFHYTNLRPLEATENHIKGARYAA